MVFRRNNRYHSKANIELALQDRAASDYASLNNISIDGLSFRTSDLIAQGAQVDIQIPITEPKFQVRAEVVWCSPSDQHFDVGVKFIEIENGYRIKTVEQLRLLEKYKMDAFFEEGRIISYETASEELLAQQRRNLN